MQAEIVQCSNCKANVKYGSMDFNDVLWLCMDCMKKYKPPVPPETKN